jgi:hypothetical protein
MDEELKLKNKGMEIRDHRGTHGIAPSG